MGTVKFVTRRDRLQVQIHGVAYKHRVLDRPRLRRLPEKGIFEGCAAERLPAEVHALRVAGQQRAIRSRHGGHFTPGAGLETMRQDGAVDLFGGPAHQRGETSR
jgi:hypothetical protein